MRRVGPHLARHEPLVLVAGPQPGGRPLALEDCLDREWTSGLAHSPDRRLLHRWAGELGIAPEVTLETEDLHSMLAMIRAGLAVGWIPAGLIDGSLTGGEHGGGGVQRVVLPPGSAPMRREVLAVSRPGTRPPIADELVALLTRALRDVGA
ncbi:substrate-binding domain-containing protein [Streptomyces nigra]|uniref:substrate-binding domain-containing protein n=1 Tax=Streptomyces nigra TaxID=1827580 RepID=UPI0037F32D08